MSDNPADIDKRTMKLILSFQKQEILGYAVYKSTAKRIKNESNRKIIEEISQDEFSHAKVWSQYTGRTVKPNPIAVWIYSFLSIILGFTFIIKLLERGENTAAKGYLQIIERIPETKEVIADEERHEKELIDLLDEERLHYIGSMVLGLNDALVELGGALAGLTFALGNNRLVALSGLITGISATFSMASSEYLSAKSDGQSDALKSSLYTGLAYLFTVAALILPYLLLPSGSALPALLIMLVIALVIIFAFNFYISIAKDLNFTARFFEMALISMGVAALSFVVGLLVKQFLGIDI